MWLQIMGVPYNECVTVVIMGHPALEEYFIDLTYLCLELASLDVEQL